jgi:predicted nucleotidyltransferase component of viral defense system
MAKAPKVFLNALTFRTSLEERLNQAALKEGVDPQRLRRQVAFDRLLARLLGPEGSWWVLKGGYALELRLKLARATRDIDLVQRAVEKGEGKDAVLAELQETAAADLKDFFIFRIGQPMMDLRDAPSGGARYPVEAVMDGRRFVSFHLDVAQGDKVLEPLDWIEEKDWLDFAGISPAKLPVLSKEQHFAEKLHAYTLPRKGAENTRVRDLVDMVLLTDRFELEAGACPTSLFFRCLYSLKHCCLWHSLPPANRPSYVR